MTSQDIAALVERLEQQHQVYPRESICAEAASALRTLAAENEGYADYRKWAERTVEGVRANLDDTRKLAEFEAQELRARIASLEASVEAGRKLLERYAPKHSNACSNQNPLNPLGAFYGAKECSCNQKEP